MKRWLVLILATMARWAPRYYTGPAGANPLATTPTGWIYGRTIRMALERAPPYQYHRNRQRSHDRMALQSDSL